MRITLLIVLIITALSKNFANIYETEKQIQKETLNKCILNSNELIKDLKKIYGDIRKAFINHNYLEILKRLGEYNPRNNKILFQCFNKLLDEEDDIVLERGPSSHSSGRSSPSKSSPSRSSPSRSSPSKSSPNRSSPSRSSPAKTNPTKTNPPKSNPTKANPPKSNPPKSNPTKANPPKSNPTKSNPTKSNPPKSNPPKSNPTKSNPPKTNPTKSNLPKSNPPKSNRPKSNPTKTNPPKSNPTKSNPPKTNPTNTHVKDKNKNTQNNNKKVNTLNSKPFQWANKILGKKGKAEFGVTPNSVSAGGQYTTHKGNQDTTYSGKMKVQKEKGKTGVSLTGGKMTTHHYGPAYTKRGQEHEISANRINDGRKKGYEGSYTNRQINGKGYKIGNTEYAQTNIRERKYSAGATKSKDGRYGINLGYDDTKSHKKSLSIGGKEVSRTDYNTKSYSGNAGIKRTSQGYNADASFARKNINGRKYQIGKASYTHENEKGIIVKGSGNINKHGGNLGGSVENYDKTTHRAQFGSLKAEVSKKDYQKAAANVRFKNKNGVTTANAGASYATGTKYEGKFGNLGVNAGKEDKTSVNAGIKASKHGVKVNAQVQDSHRYSAGFNLGNKFRTQASAGRTQTANAQASFNRNGAKFKANYEQAYDAKAHVKVGNTDVKARGRISENTYGSASVQAKNGKLNAQAKVGREYRAGGGLTLNGKKVASVDALAKGEVGGKVKASKNRVSAQAGVNGQAGAKATFGKTDVKFSVKADFHAGVTFDSKTGLHFNVGGGIHAEASIKDRKTGKKTVKKADVKLMISKGKPSYILYRKRKIISKKNMKKAQKNKILGQACRPSIRRV